jgi:signal transduction histidine kinase
MTGAARGHAVRVHAAAARLAGRAWFRALIDVLLVAVAAVDALPGETPAWNMSFVTSVVALPALLVRRRWPVVAWLLATPAGIWGNALVAPLVALFTVADHVRRVWLVWLASAAALTGYFISTMVSGDAGPVGSVGTLQELIYAALFAVMPTALGLLMRARRTLRAQLESLAASQAREQTLVTEALLAAERTRLAREMHDVVSHQVSLIALQAGAMRVTAADDTIRQSAATIRTLAVKTLDELRAMVGVLRGRPEAPQLAPQPRLSDLCRLVEDSQTGAELVTDAVSEQEWPMPVERAVYRAVQEGLTNIGKHASGAAARVEVRAAGRTLSVRVSNGPPPAGPAIPGNRKLPGSGHGLLGLRERAELFGGQLTAGTTADGGFELHVTFNA